jgi:hypothetical protein
LNAADLVVPDRRQVGVLVEDSDQRPDLVIVQAWGPEAAKARMGPAVRVGAAVD